MTDRSAAMTPSTRGMAYRRVAPVSLLLASILASCPGRLVAEVQHDAQLWVNSTVIGSLSGDVLYFVEVQPRVGDDVSRLSTLLLRTAAGWRINPTLSVYQGYAHVVTPVARGRDRNEERLFQQVSWTLRPGATEVQSRTRLEQRWLSSGPGTGVRLRQMIRVETPMRGTRIKPLVSVEPFLAFNSSAWGQRQGFDQVRSFAGAEIPLKGKSTLEAGYLNQLVNAPGDSWQMRHALSLILFVRP